MYDFQDTTVSPAVQELLKPALAKLNDELSAMQSAQHAALSTINALDTQFAAKIKEVYDAVAVITDNPAVDADDTAAIQDFLSDVTGDALYDWTSNRPLEFQFDEDDGTVEFWEPSSC